MKKFLTLILALGNFIAFGQSRNISKSIQDDGRLVSVHVSGTVDGRNIAYDHTFDVSGMSKSERMALKDKVMESLDLSAPTTPEAPLAPEVMIPLDPVSKKEKPASASRETKSELIGGMVPYTKEVRYNHEAGEMFMRYKYERDGEQFEYERTLNVKGKSQAERQKIIKATESELGLSSVQ